MERARKQEEIELLTQRFTEAKLAVCADYRGLTVLELSELRRKLREGGASAKVVRNTLAKISAEKVLKDDSHTEIERFKALLEGPNFVVFAEKDVVASAKVMTEYAKKFKSLEIKGGWFEGRCLDSKGVEALSTVPSKQESWSMLLSLLGTPATQIVRVLSAPAAQLVRVLEAYRKKLEDGPK